MCGLSLRLALALGASGRLANALAFPSGARGLYYAADYSTTSRKAIPNRVADGALAADQNLFSAPRRMFALTGIWDLSSIGSGNSVADNAAAGPDGTTGAASLLSAAGTANWQIRLNGTNINLPAGTYTVCISARLASGTGTFKMGDFSVGQGSFTATATWQRFTKTFVSAGGNSFQLLSGNAAAPQQIEFCDYELFAGSSDLNPNPLGAAPLCIQREDLRLGRHNYDANIAVGGGYLVHGAAHVLQLATDFPLGAFSLVILAKRAAAPSTNGFNPLLAVATANDYAKLIVGFSGGEGSGAVDWYNGNPQSAWNSLSKQVYSELNFRQGDGAYVTALTYDGTTLSSYMNGVKTQSSVQSAGLISIKDLWIGLLSGTFFSGQDIAAIGLWPRALSASEVNSAGNVFQSATGILANADPLIAAFGTSITFGNGGKSYVFDYPANASKAVHGFNGGQSSAQIGAIAHNIDAFLAQLSANPSRPAQIIVVSIEAGANDLNGILAGDTASCDVWLATLASKCDAARAAGCKVVIHTVLSRTDGTAQSTTNINTNRAYVNPIIRNWVGIGAGKHVDAVVDIAADPVVGTDASTNNLTNFPDKVHPSASMYSTYWEPLFRAAVNPLI